jgi:hypothetical protein
MFVTLNEEFCITLRKMNHERVCFKNIYQYLFSFSFSSCALLGITGFLVAVSNRYLDQSLSLVDDGDEVL